MAAGWSLGGPEDRLASLFSSFRRVRLNQRAMRGAFELMPLNRRAHCILVRKRRAAARPASYPTVRLPLAFAATKLDGFA